MALLKFWKSDPITVDTLSIEQIVSNAGDGVLRDGSDCSSELRAYLAEVKSTKLADYAEHCLNRAFPRSGLVLQDLVNELARRLGFDVRNGRYQGIKNAIGYDGIWRAPEGHAIVCEVKTTDAYRIALEIVAGYRSELVRSATITGSSSILVVVGREDTGELEAQVRGSRFAWDIRLISVSALCHLVELKEGSNAPDTERRIRGILSPVEFTRLDSLIETVFAAAKDISEEVETIPEIVAEVLPRSDASRNGSQIQITPGPLLRAKRDVIVDVMGARLGDRLIQRTRATFSNVRGDKRISCTLSKRYPPGKYPYWFAFHPQWLEFLAAGEEGRAVFGCMDQDVAFALPVEFVRSLLGKLNVSNKPDGERYWHVVLVEPTPGTMALQLADKAGTITLAPYTVQLPASS